MRIRLATVFTNDLPAAVAFYTDVLGFTKKRDIPLGGGASWITVVSPQEPDGCELLLEPAGHPAVEPYREALMEDGIPLAQFTVDDVEQEYARLTAAGVKFTQKPIDIGAAWVAVFDDTVGNLIQIVAEK
ncbi:MAG: VOC family protein [Dermatophilaceae bacterium]